MNVWEMKLPTGPGVRWCPSFSALGIPLPSQIVQSAEKSDLEQALPSTPQETAAFPTIPSHCNGSVQELISRRTINLCQYHSQALRELVSVVARAPGDRHVGNQLLLEGSLLTLFF